jgi:hypothetical protein
MIPTTEWDGEFIADLAAERAGLGEPEVLHRSRDEHGWWRQAGIDPIKVARRLWNAARRDPLAGSSRLAAAWSRIMTRGRSNEPAGEDISNLGSIVGPANAAAHAAALGVMGLLTKPLSTISKTFDPTERSSVASSAVDPRTVIELELVHRTRNLLWRLRRASANKTGLFELQGEALSARQSRHFIAKPFPRMINLLTEIGKLWFPPKQFLCLSGVAN